MKKAILVSALMSSFVMAGAVQASNFNYPNMVKPHHFKVGLQYMDVEVDRFDVSSSTPSLELGYGYRFNRYLELGVSASFKTSGDVTSESVDTFIIPDQSSGEAVLGAPLRTTYENSLSQSTLLGMNAKVSFPLTGNLDIYATIGATYGDIKHEGFANVGAEFIDNPNTVVDTEGYLEGIASGESICALTGIEAACGTPIQPYTEEFDSVSVSYGAGFRWLWFDSGSTHIINIGATSLFNKDDFTIMSYGVSYEYQF